jgi:diacylglycerol kinase family enzyme
VRVALIANAASGSGLDPEPLVRAMEAHAADVEVFGCEEGELERASRREPERLVVAGGDGTVASVADLAGRLDVPLGVIPGGTANDFVRALELPLDPVAAAELAVSGTELRRLELGRLADGRPFVNAASAGLAAKAARHASPFKRMLGPLAYAVGALRAATTESPMRCSLRIDGETRFQGGAWQVIVAVTASWTLRCSPQARGSRSLAAPGACVAAPSSSRSRSSTTAVAWSRPTCRPTPSSTWTARSAGPGSSA